MATQRERKTLYTYGTPAIACLLNNQAGLRHIDGGSGLEIPHLPHSKPAPVPPRESSARASLTATVTGIAMALPATSGMKAFATQDCSQPRPLTTCLALTS